MDKKNSRALVLMLRFHSKTKIKKTSMISMKKWIYFCIKKLHFNFINMEEKKYAIN